MMNLFSLLAAFDNLDPMNKDVLLKSLDILWQGLLAIFVVIGLIIIAVKITSAILSKVEKANRERANREENSDEKLS